MKAAMLQGPLRCAHNFEALQQDKNRIAAEIQDEQQTTDAGGVP